MGYGTTGQAGAQAALRARLREGIGGAVSAYLHDRGRVSTGGADRRAIERLVDEAIEEQRLAAARNNATPLLADAAAFRQELLDHFCGLGRLEPLMRDPGVQEIMINGPSRVLVRRDGRSELVGDIWFDDEEEILALVRRVAGGAGRRLDESSPKVDVRLPDGSRLNAIIPPVSLIGPVVTIRRFTHRGATLADLVANGTLTPSAAAFLRAAVLARLNIGIVGGTGSGKTTLLNALGLCLADSTERVITIEQTSELTLHQSLIDCVALQEREPNLEGKGRFTMRDCLTNALRMYPKRIVVGEVRGGEAMDMLIAMNTGHDGSLGTWHANSPLDGVTRLVNMALLADERLPRDAVLDTVARTLHLIVQIAEVPRDRVRRVTEIFEVTGLVPDRGNVAGHSLWKLDAGGVLAYAGIAPRAAALFGAAGVAWEPPPTPPGGAA